MDALNPGLDCDNLQINQKIKVAETGSSTTFASLVLLQPLDDLADDSLTSTDSSTSTSSVTVTVSSVGGVMVLLAGVIVAVHYSRKRRSTAENGKNQVLTSDTVIVGNPLAPTNNGSTTVRSRRVSNIIDIQV